MFRKRYGVVRAYLMTVMMIVLHPRRFAREMCRPVRICADDAWRFRRLTIRMVLVLGFVTAVMMTWIQLVGGAMHQQRRIGGELRVACAKAGQHIVDLAPHDRRRFARQR